MMNAQEQGASGSDRVGSVPHSVDYDAPRYLAWDAPTLDRAAEHGCLDENVQTGDPTVCAMCVTPPMLSACGMTFDHYWHGYLDDDGRTRVCDGTPRVTPPGQGNADV